MIKTFYINDRLYYAVGDITTIDEHVISLMISNKELADDLGKNDIYQYDIIIITK